VKSETEFLSKLADADVAWILSAESLTDSYLDAEGKVDTAAVTAAEEKFVDTIFNYHQGGGGLFIWAENAPFIYHANLLLHKIFGVKLAGSTPGNQILSLGDCKTHGHFGGHLVTTGLHKLYEGDSISYLEDEKSIPDKLEVLVTSSDGKALLFAGNTALFDKDVGRICVDSGFTKLFMHWDTAGTARYVKNCCVWLLGIDHRIASDQPLRGKRKQDDSKVEYIWQYNHGKWHDFDQEANKIVEGIYQAFLADPHVDINAIKSGHYQYMIDFNAMKQTNIEHEAHTVRDIRRIKASESTARYT